MDDETSEFFIMVGEMSELAARADLPIRVRMRDGRELTGLAQPPAHRRRGSLDDTGFEDGLRVGGEDVVLHDVVEFSVRRASRHRV